MEDGVVYSLEDQESSGDKSSQECFDNVLSLRMSSSFLEELDSSSEIFLSGGAGEDNLGESQLRISVREGTVRELLLHSESVSPVDVFKQSGTSCSGEKQLVRIGTVSTRHTGGPSNETRVKELGRKARERLEEELAKKKEIVHLDIDNDNPVSVDRNAPGAFSKALRRTAKKTIRKRKQPAVKKVEKHAIPRIDQWVPETSHFVKVGKEERSSFVRLHGLPLDAHPEHIKKFFLGLNPERILVLPNHSIFIPQWDAIDPSKAPKIKRHPSNFRVFVKFKSSQIADMAIERSGEAIEGAAVALTMTTKSDTNVLLRNMGVDVLSGMSIRAFLSELEKHLPSIVPTILWTAALKHLEIPAESQSDDPFTWQSERDYDPSNFSGYKQLASHHNRLLEQYDSLELSGRSLCVLESSEYQQAIDFLVSAALNFLLKDIERLDRALIKGRGNN